MVSVLRAFILDASVLALCSARAETAAYEFTRRIHDRMPVLLGHHDLDAWLTGKAGGELLQPAPNDVPRMWPVSKRVNVSGRRDDDRCLIEPVEDDAIASD